MRKQIAQIKPKQVIAIILIAMLIFDLVLFGLRRINGIYFWAVIVAAALLAYFVIPKMK